MFRIINVILSLVVLFGQVVATPQDTTIRVTQNGEIVINNSNSTRQPQKNNSRIAPPATLTPAPSTSRAPPPDPHRRFVGVEQGQVSEFKCPQNQVITQIVGTSDNAGIKSLQFRCFWLQPATNVSAPMDAPPGIPLITLNNTAGASNLTNATTSQVFGDRGGTSPGNPNVPFGLPYSPDGVRVLEIGYDQQQITSIGYGSSRAGIRGKGNQVQVTNPCPMTGIGIRFDSVVRAIRMFNTCFPV